MTSDFQQRLQQAFGFATMAGIARRLGLPHATVRNYFRGRLPAPEVLIKIANETNVSLNWLLIGTGDMFIDQAKHRNFGELIERKLEEMIERKLSERNGEDVLELGDVDVAAPDFDVEAALGRTNDPQEVMREWFRHEGREYPQDYGIAFFHGWESYSESEKLDAIKDAKKVLDRSLKNKSDDNA